MKRKKRVRVHLIDPPGGGELPSVEGLLVNRSGGHYLIAVASLLQAAGAQPLELESKALSIPRERVAFYEIL